MSASPKRIAIALVVASLPALPAQAQLRPATADHIGEAVGRCIAATSTAGLNLERLAEGGWQRAKTQSGEEKVDAPIPIYGKAGNRAVIIAAPTEAAPACIVTARIEHFDVVSATTQGMSRALKVSPMKSEGNETYWRYGPLIIQLAATGTREKPGIRVGVVAVAGEKK